MMEQKARKPRAKLLSILLLPAAIVGILASFQKYDEIKNGTAEWDSKYKEPWYFHHPDGFFIYIIIEAVILICIFALAIANIVTRKEKYFEIAFTLYILVRLAEMINKFIKG